MKVRSGALGLLVLLSGCMPSKSGGNGNSPQPDPVPTHAPTPTPSPTVTPEPPPVEGEACAAEGLQEARGIGEPTLRAAFCIQHAKEKKCSLSEDYLVTCMTLAGDLNPAATREHIRHIMNSYGKLE